MEQFAFQQPPKNNMTISCMYTVCTASKTGWDSIVSTALSLLFFSHSEVSNCERWVSTQQVQQQRRRDWLHGHTTTRTTIDAESTVGSWSFTSLQQGTVVKPPPQCRCSSVCLFVCLFVCRLKRVLVGHWPDWPSNAGGRERPERCWTSQEY